MFYHEMHCLFTGKRSILKKKTRKNAKGIKSELIELMVQIKENAKLYHRKHCQS